MLLGCELDIEEGCELLCELGSDILDCELGCDELSLLGWLLDCELS